VLPTLSAGRVALRPLTADDAATLAVAMLEHPSVRRWWGTPGTREERREELLNEGRAFAIEVDGALAGWLGFEEELEPDYKHAGLDISLLPDLQGAGHGPAALLLAARWLVDERGHHRITIDPAARNARAIRAYRAAGFRDVGIMRRCERSPEGVWEDGLLMDLLADELAP
jgi:aminoglycoside 6'-N-acetyltransferase